MLLNLLQGAVVGIGAVQGILRALQQLEMMASQIASIFDREAQADPAMITQQTLDADRVEMMGDLAVSGGLESLGWAFLSIGTIIATIAAPILAVVTEPFATAGGVIATILPIGTSAMESVIGYYMMQEEGDLQ